MHGFPPKVIWIRRGNCSTGDIEILLRDHHAEIEDLAGGIVPVFNHPLPQVVLAYLLARFSS